MSAEFSVKQDLSSKESVADLDFQPRLGVCAGRNRRSKKSARVGALLHAGREARAHYDRLPRWSAGVKSKLAKLPPWYRCAVASSGFFCARISAAQSSAFC